MRMQAQISGRSIHEGIYYSIGGGFIASEAELSRGTLDGDEDESAFPYNFKSAKQMLEMGARSGLSIAQMKAANERVKFGANLETKLSNLWSVMNSVIDAGLSRSGLCRAV